MLKKTALVAVFGLVSFVSLGFSSKASLSSVKPETSVTTPVARGLCGLFGRC